MAYGSVCEQCQHPASDHRLSGPPAEWADRLFECWITGCACMIDGDAPLRPLDEHQFRAMFPGWTSARHKGWTPPTPVAAASGHVGGGRRP